MRKGNFQNWRDLLNERQRKEIEFCEHYARDFGHGTDGHNKMMLIAKLAGYLDIYLAGIEYEFAKITGTSLDELPPKLREIINHYENRGEENG